MALTVSTNIETSQNPERREVLKVLSVLWLGLSVAALTLGPGIVRNEKQKEKIMLILQEASESFSSTDSDEQKAQKIQTFFDNQWDEPHGFQWVVRGSVIHTRKPKNSLRDGREWVFYVDKKGRVVSH